MLSDYFLYNIHVYILRLRFYFFNGICVVFQTQLWYHSREAPTSPFLSYIKNQTSGSIIDMFLDRLQCRHVIKNIWKGQIQKTLFKQYGSTKRKQRTNRKM